VTSFGRIRRHLASWMVAVALLLAPHAGLAAPDADGDGLPDAWEERGVMLDGGAGARWIDLPAMGADPRRPDIFLQIDWMEGAGHRQRPSAQGIRLVIEAFANAPYVSPTGSVGIALHVDAGPNSLLDASGATWGTLSRARAIPWKKNLGTAAKGSYDWKAFDAIRNEIGGFRDTGRAPVFHYAIFGQYHDLDDPHGGGASGIARGIGGTDLLVTLGNFTDGVGTPREQAGTIMHELGHNLGLRHGGCDDSNMKAGYASVMNYAFQMEGIVRGGTRGVLDYSRGASPPLDDALVDDPIALLVSTWVDGSARARSCVASGSVGAGSAVRPPPPLPAVSRADDACDGSFNDWANIRLRVGTIGRGAPLSPPPSR
jgi:hypothetical protein